MYLRTCGSFKSANHKKSGSENRKSTKSHICGRSANLTNYLSPQIYGISYLRNLLADRPLWQFHREPSLTCEAYSTSWRTHVEVSHLKTLDIGWSMVTWRPGVEELVSTCREWTSCRGYVCRQDYLESTYTVDCRWVTFRDHVIWGTYYLDSSRQRGEVPIIYGEKTLRKMVWDTGDLVLFCYLYRLPGEIV
jgi:hypothetical protein